MHLQSKTLKTNSSRYRGVTTLYVIFTILQYIWCCSFNLPDSRLQLKMKTITYCSMGSWLRPYWCCHNCEISNSILVIFKQNIDIYEKTRLEKLHVCSVRVGDSGLRNAQGLFTKQLCRRSCLLNLPSLLALCLHGPRGEQCVRLFGHAHMKQETNTACTWQRWAFIWGKCWTLLLWLILSIAHCSKTSAHVVPLGAPRSVPCSHQGYYWNVLTSAHLWCRGHGKVHERSVFRIK